MTGDLALAWRQFRLERRMFWRNPSAAFFNFALPLLFLALFGAIFSGDQKALDVIVPGIAGLAVMSTTFSALAMNLTFLREQGVLKRMRGTPLPERRLPGRHRGQRGHERAHPDHRSSSWPAAPFFGIGWPKDWAALVALRRPPASSAWPRSASRGRTSSPTSTRRRPT